MISFDYRDKVVLVTGAGKSIGYSIATEFARAGAKVALNDIDATVCHDAVASLREQGYVVNGYPFDIADVAAVGVALEHIVHDFGRIDIGILNAGLIVQGPLLDIDVETFDRLMAVNMRGTFFSAQWVAKQMIRQGDGGKLVLPSSINGYTALPNIAAYAMTKTAMISLARNLALELAPHRINVNALAIGATFNEHNLKREPDYEEKWDRVTPTGRLNRVEDTAYMTLFLCSPQASQVNGQTIIIDGGYTVHGEVLGGSVVAPQQRERGDWFRG
jgi:3-oxoacyl-[acyl-carrier protein] reductase